MTEIEDLAYGYSLPSGKIVNPNSDRIMMVYHNYCINSNFIFEKLLKHGKHFDEHDKRFDALAECFEKITQILLAHEKRLDDLQRNMATLYRLDRERQVAHARIDPIKKSR